MSGRPPLFDPLVWSIAWRFARGHRSRLLSGTARSALLATAIGVTAMVIAMALMTGYRQELRGRLIRGNAAVVVYPVGPEEQEIQATAMKSIEGIEGVRAVRRVVYGQGSLTTRAAPLGVDVTLRGLDSSRGLPDLERLDLEPGFDPQGGLVAEGMPVVILGSGLADRLTAEDDEAVRLMVLGFDAGRPRFRYRSVHVAGTFTSGFSEFDRSWAMIDRFALEDLLGLGVEASLYEVGIDRPEESTRIAAEIRGLLGEGYLVTDWQELNRELFTALRVQQIALFFVLGLIVLVSTFNVASSLVVLVRERMRDLGVLAAVGLAPEQLRTVFILFGALLGIAGTLCGVAVGSAASWVLTEFELIRFDSEVAAIYFIRSVPFRVHPPDLLAVVGFTLAVTLLACWLPSRRAGSLQPAAALRYE